MRKLIFVAILLLLPAPALAQSSSIWVAQFGVAANQLNFADSANGNTVPAQTFSYVSSSGPWGVAIDASGNIWVSDQSNNAIYQFLAASSGAVTPSVTISGGSTLLNSPAGLAFDASGNLWVGNNQSLHQVLEFSAAQLVGGGNIAPNASFSSSLREVYGIAIDPAGLLYLSFGAGEVDQYTTAGTKNWVITGGSTGLNGAQQVAVDGNANLYVANEGANTITKYNYGACTSGTSPCNISPALTISSSVSADYGVAVDSSGNIYVSNSGTPSITKYAVSGGSATATITGALTTLATTVYLAPMATSAPTAAATPSCQPGEGYVPGTPVFVTCP